jgi:hypothetical protein
MEEKSNDNHIFAQQKITVFGNGKEALTITITVSLSK